MQIWHTYRVGLNEDPRFHVKGNNTIREHQADEHSHDLVSPRLDSRPSKGYPDTHNKEETISSGKDLQSPLPAESMQASQSTACVRLDKGVTSFFD